MPRLGVKQGKSVNKFFFSLFQHSKGICLVYFLCLLTLYVTSQRDQKPPSNDGMGLFFRYHVAVEPRASLLRKLLLCKQGLRDRWNKQPCLYVEICCVAVEEFSC